MSNSQAIAGVTVMLDFLITEGVTQELGSGDLDTVTTKPPDKAREEGRQDNQINIFLYQTQPNSAWRNLDMPTKVKPGETGKPPLALNLYYLITAYGKENDDTESHRLLGVAMRVLHDHPIIRSQDIDRAIESLDEPQKTLLKNSNLKNQIERISVTPTNLSLEEISKLWGTFQTQYRISAAYEVSVVLIESQISVKTPLPVLSRGDKDRGPASQTGIIPPLPSLTAIKLPQNEYYFTVGKDLILEGYNLKNSKEVHFQYPHLEDPIVLTTLKEVSNTHIRVTLNESREWLAGFYTVTVQVKEPDTSIDRYRDRMTNSMTFPLVPEVTEISYPDEKKQLTLTCNPPVKAGQEVALLLGDRAIPYGSTIRKSDRLTFNVSNVTPGKYVVRLRVDGVDSVPIDFTQQPPKFKDEQKVTINK